MLISQANPMPSNTGMGLSGLQRRTYGHVRLLFLRRPLKPLRITRLYGLDTSVTFWLGRPRWQGHRNWLADLDMTTVKKLTGEESESVHVNEKTCSFVLLNGQR